MRIDKIIDKLYEKEFKNQIKGYNKEEVDAFLDETIEILEQLNTNNLRFEGDFKKLEQENFKLKMEILKIKEQRITLDK